jgi:hypothetical protein
MMRFGLLLTSLAACASGTVDTTARFHGQVGNSVTHVMAVSPIAGDVERVVAATQEGTFTVEVEPGRPWTLVFVDATQTGARMVRGVLRSDTLDTFNPQVAGDIDLGKISIDAQDATMAGSSEDLDHALGLSRRTLATIGGLDDLAVRYVNPDVDSDGIIDVEQARFAQLEVHAEYQIVARGREASPEDYLSDWQAVAYEHRGTGVYGRLPASFGPVEREDADVTFEMPYYGYWAGPSSSAIPAGQPVTHLTFGDDRTFGVFCRPEKPVPKGTYTFRSGAHTLDFAMVRPPTEMTMHQVMPRIRFVPLDPACTKNCEVETIEFAWQRRVDGGWITLIDEEAHALQPVGSIDMVFSDGGHRRYEFPIGIATGSVPWQLDIYTTAQQRYRTGDISFTSVTFQSRPGMKMYARMGDGYQAPRPDGMPMMDDFVTR